MRRILIEHARWHAAGKRSGPRDKVAIDRVPESPDPEARRQVDLVKLHEALTRLGEIKPRAAQVVELRYLGGLTHEEIAQVLDVSVPTVSRDWEAARLWLRSKLRD